MRPNTRRVPLLIVLFIAILGATAPPPPVAAQGGGSIRGTVVSKDDHRPIPGAQVFVGANRASLTNESGEYVVADVPAGTYQVRVRLIGFGEATDTVTVTAGQVATADFALERKVMPPDAVTVTALGIDRAKRETPYDISGVNGD